MTKIIKRLRKSALGKVMEIFNIEFKSFIQQIQMFCMRGCNAQHDKEREKRRAYNAEVPVVSLIQKGEGKNRMNIRRANFSLVF